MRREIDADRRALGHAGAQVKAAIMLGALDDVAHHQSLGQMHFFMRAEAVRRVILVVFCAVNREGAARMVEARHILRLDVVRGAGVYPVWHCVRSW